MKSIKSYVLLFFPSYSGTIILSWAIQKILSDLTYRGRSSVLRFVFFGFLIIMVYLPKYVYTYYVYNKLDLYTPNYIDVENIRNALQSNITRIIYVRIICHNQGFELDGFTYFLVAYSKSDSTQIYFKIHTTQIQKCMLHIFAYFTGIKWFCMFNKILYVNTYYASKSTKENFKHKLNKI